MTEFNTYIDMGVIKAHRNLFLNMKQSVKVRQARVNQAKAYARGIGFSGEWLDSAEEDVQKNQAVVDSTVYDVISMEKATKRLRHEFFENYGFDETRIMIDIVYSDIPEKERKSILKSITDRKA